MPNRPLVKKEITLLGQAISYTLRYSARSRNIRMSIGHKDGLVVSIPGPWHERFVEKFLKEKATWILKHLDRMKKMGDKTFLKLTKEEYEKNKHIFLESITRRVEFFNALYGFRYQKISVRNQTSLWGSCTRAGNLQFNYKLSLLPKEAIDYVVVHEICHLQEHNHGPGFWKLVSKTIPNYKIIRKSLRQYVMGGEVL
jgi:predicted metal-dependent hydrolase